MTRTFSSLFSGLLLLAVARPADAKTLTVDDIFPTDRVIDVQITVSDENWNKLRNQDLTNYDWSNRRTQAPLCHSDQLRQPCAECEALL